MFEMDSSSKVAQSQNAIYEKARKLMEKRSSFSTKAHPLVITITNATGDTLFYHDDWFDSGRFNEHPVSEIRSGEACMITLCNKDWAFSGVSGWFAFTDRKGMCFGVSYSNPKAGNNKCKCCLSTASRVKDDCQHAWDSMENGEGGSTFFNGYKATWTTIHGNISHVLFCKA